MRKTIITLLALAGVALAAAPASAQWHHGWHHGGWGHRGGVGIYFGAAPYYPAYGAYPGYAAPYCARERIVRIRPNGTRVIRWVRRCY